MHKAVLEVPVFQFGVDNPVELTFDLWAEKYREAVGDYQYGKDEPFLHEFYNYLKKRLDDATKKKAASDRIEALKKDAELEKRDSYNAGDLVVLDEDGKVYSVDYITTEGDVIPGQQNTYTTYYHLKGNLLGKYTADQLTGIKPKSDEGTGEEGPGEPPTPPTPPTPPASDEGKSEISEEERRAREKFSKVVTAEMVVASQTGEKPYKSIVDLRKRAREMGMKVDDSGRDDILLQELVEDGLVRAANQIIGTRMTLARLHGENSDEVRRSKELFDRIVSLYDMQPTIAARSTGRIQNQQYSTPLPMAYVAGMFAYEDGMEKGLEPTAGNGMLTIAVPAHKVHANEIDEIRLANLRGQNFAEVTDQDATQPFEGGRQYDFVIANPPFGSAEAKSYDGKLISGLDPQIALNALESMKDDGKAAIIIGGEMSYAKNGSILGKKQFFTYLYDHYNVKGVIDMGGKLFQKQGTTYPTMMILIDGRRSEAERGQTQVYPPRESEALPKAETFDDLYRIVNELNNSNSKTNGNEVLRTAPRELESHPVEGTRTSEQRPDNPQHTTDGNQSGGRGGRGTDTSTDVQHLQRPVLEERGQTDRAGSERGQHGQPGRVPGERGRTEGDNSGLAQREGDRGDTGDHPGRVVGGPRTGTLAGRDLVEGREKEERRSLGQEKAGYRPHSQALSLESVAPAAMAESMNASLSEIEKEVGPIDEFVRKELGYDTIEEAQNALAAEQMDSVAMAIYQMKRGQALIIGDQTGVGKGRQMAALIRWATRQGKKPIFITKDANLFSDIYRDLVDIGSGELRPFIFNDAGGKNPGVMTDQNGKEIYRSPSDAVKKSIFATGKLPDDYDYAVLSYSQVNTGDAQSREEARQAAKKNGGRAKKKEEGEPKATPKADFLRKIAKDNYMFLDESHNAAGKDSNTGAYLQSLLGDVAGVTFASATFAKTPETMPLYALRTAMSQANVAQDELIAIIEKGGVTLQEIMSRALSESGQMVRRERDMSDVKTDWKTVSDPETVKRARENYDRTIAAFNAIIDFQKKYVSAKVDELDEQLSIMAASAGIKRGTQKLGVQNVPFASKAYNYTKQLLLALKVEAIVDEVEAEIKAGRHPVIALDSTMESATKDYAIGEVIDEPTFALSLLRGLDTVMQYTVTDANGKETHERYLPEDLGPAGEKAYYELQDFIRESTKDVFISPIDAIIQKLGERGYKVGELTGRDSYVGRDASGRVVVKRRSDKDKKRMAREFNSGELDVLILNKSAATGISLHASEKFADQRQRTMIIAQSLGDITDYMQMIGRIDRTGQVHRGYYINLGLPVPAESRFLMMLATKLKSLNANTTTSQESKSSDVDAPDLLNKYGSQVIIEYLRDNPDIYEKMGMPLGKQSDPVKPSELEEYKSKEDDARKITGSVALLSTEEQDAFYDDVVKRYNDLIKYLDETGTNDLKITVMPLRAKTLSKKVSSEGVDPTGKNPFAGNAYVEEVDMDVLRKPMKAEEVRRTIEQLNGATKVNEETGGIESPRIQEIKDVVARETEEKLQSEEERYERAKERMAEDIRKRTEKINASKRTPEEKREAIEQYSTEQAQKAEEAHTGNVNRINAVGQNLTRRMDWFRVGQTCMVPDDLGTETYMFMSPAIFCGFKAKDSKITPSTTFAVFATLDGRRRIEVKMSQITPLISIKNATDNNWDTTRRTTLENWDSQLPKSSRKKGYIMTGNILQAVSDTQDQQGNYPGQLISYTDEEGNIHDGILMPDKWQPSQLKTAGVPIGARAEQIKSMGRNDEVRSTDGKITLSKERWGSDFYLDVPKSKKEGGKFYLNDELLKLVRANGFFTHSGKMRAEIPAENIERVVQILSNNGIRVETGEDKEDESARFRTSEELDEEQVMFRESEDAMLDRLVDEMGYFAALARKTMKGGGYSKAQRETYARAEWRRAHRNAKGVMEKLHIADDIVVVDSADQIPAGVPMSAKKRAAKGWYDTKTGKIYVILGNHLNSADVTQTLLHEAVAHYGLRKLFGSHFDTFLDSVLDNVTPEIRQRILDNAAKNNWSKREAVEEYLASLAEDGSFKDFGKAGTSIWDKIKRLFTEMLRDLGLGEYFGDQLSDNELRYILWRSYKNLEEPGYYNSPFSLAEDIAMQHSLAVGNYGKRNVDKIMSSGRIDMSGWGREVADGDRFRTSPEIDKQVGGLWSIEHTDDVESYGAENVRTKYGLKGSSNVQYAHKAEEVMQIAEYLPEEDAKTLRKFYLDGETKAYYSPTLDLVIVFAEKCESADDAELAEWHEQTHGNFNHLNLPNKDDLANEILNFLAIEYPDAYRHITDNYEEKDWKKEAVSYFVEETIRRYGVENFLGGEFAGNEKVRILADEIRNTFKNGYNYEETSNQRGRSNEVDGRKTILPEETGLRGGPRDGVEYDEKGNRRVPQETGRSSGAGETESELRSVARNRNNAPGLGNVKTGSARANYEAAQAKSSHRAKETTQDSMQAVKDLQTAVIGETGGKLLDTQNAWMAENRLSSANKAQIDEFKAAEMKSLLKAVEALGGENAKRRAEISRYLMAKHGLERNRVFEPRDGRKDYSGLTSMFGESDVDAAEQKAREFVDDFEANNDAQKVADLWDAVRGVSGFTLRKALKSGLISKESFYEISGQFQFYVPLRGWSETTTDEMYGYFNQHSSPLGNPIKRAEGRSSEADDPIANLQNVAESAIISGNRNLVKQHFLNLAVHHRTSLMSVSEGWLEYDDATGKWELKLPKIDPNDSPEQVNQKVEQFNAGMKVKAENDPTHYKRQHDAVDIPYVVYPGTLSEHQVIVKQGGKTYIVTVNGNPRAAQAMNGLTNPEANNDPNFKMVAAGTRIIAKMATGLNLTFMARNLVRDGLYVGPMVFVKEGAKYGAKYSANWWAGLVEMPILVFKHKFGLLDRSKPLDRLFYDFIHNGGETGYTIAESVDDCRKYIEGEFRSGLDPRNWWSKLERLFEYLGRVSEGISRFAAYRTSIEMGRSGERAIYDAKDISVNFNKKGAGLKSADKNQPWWVRSLAGLSQYGRSYIAFFNPAIQGLENVTRATRQHPWRSATLFASLAALGASQALLNKMLVAMLGGDDDDDYYNIPDYIRKSHFCIYVGDHKYIRLALPQEFSVPFSLAGLWQERLDNPRMSNKEFGLRFAESVSMALPVDPVRGESYFSPDAFLPTAARPAIYDVPSNEAWTGLPIYKEYQWNKHKPEYQRAYSNTGKGYVAASKWLHEFGGGNEGRRANNEELYEWNPAKIEYLAKQYLSGTYGWFAFPVKAVERIASGEEIETKDWPVVRGFVTETDERMKEKRINKYFFEMKDQEDKTKHEYDTFVKLGKEANIANDTLKYAERLAKVNEIQNSEGFREYQVWHTGDRLLEKAQSRNDKEDEKFIRQIMVEAVREFRDTDKSKEDAQNAAMQLMEKYQMAHPDWEPDDADK